MAGAPNPLANLFRLDGRVAFIAGGSGAIGSAVGEALAGWGASIAIAGRTKARVEETAGGLAATGATSLSVLGDVTNQADCERMVAETLKRLAASTSSSTLSEEAPERPFTQPSSTRRTSGTVSST